MDSISNNFHDLLIKHGFSVGETGKVLSKNPVDEKVVEIFENFIQVHRTKLSEQDFKIFKKIQASIEPILNPNFKDYVAKMPTVSAEMDEAGKLKLLENLDPETRKIAERALQEVRYIPFKMFLQGLEHATHQMCQKMAPTEKFVVLYDPIMGKSGIWTAKLAYEFLEKEGRKPVRVEEWSWFDNPDIPVKEENKKITRIVIFDDATYSGTQMKRALEKLEKEKSLKKHFPNAQITLVIPYVTQAALDLIQPTEVFFHEKMAPFPRNLVFKCNNPDFKEDFDGSTATYMQHKVAAGGHSTVPFIKAGLLKEIAPPYAISNQ